VAPLFGVAQRPEQIVERRFVFCPEVEPGKKIEWLWGGQIATMMQPPSDVRQRAQTNLNVLRTLLEDRSPFILRKRPPGVTLLDGNERAAYGFRSPNPFLNTHQLPFLRSPRVTLVTHHATKYERAARRVRL